MLMRLFFFFLAIYLWSNLFRNLLYLMGGIISQGLETVNCFGRSSRLSDPGDFYAISIISVLIKPG